MRRHVRTTIQRKTTLVFRTEIAFKSRLHVAFVAVPSIDLISAQAKTKCSCGDMIQLACHIKVWCYDFNLSSILFFLR